MSKQFHLNANVMPKRNQKKKKERNKETKKKSLKRA